MGQPSPSIRFFLRLEFAHSNQQIRGGSTHSSHVGWIPLVAYHRTSEMYPADCTVHVPSNDPSVADLIRAVSGPFAVNGRMDYLMPNHWSVTLFDFEEAQLVGMGLTGEASSFQLSIPNVDFNKSLGAQAWDRWQ